MNILRQERMFHASFNCADLTACGRFINTAKRGDGPVLLKAGAGFLLPARRQIKQQLTGGIQVR
tara:strand:- start:148 stop:339 length:192 start_codon:yes stop_codon:yes gene_type:complete